ncbi:MAG: hypothetical protein IT455_17665 [Planctomycetes bacterium]|nr:hypothetical protein [Planctomycetota bacterium]
MRTPAAVLLLGLTTGCTSMVLAEPKLLVSPYYALYQIRGKVSMQSRATPTSAPEDNTPQDLRTFGQDHHKDDVGVRVDLGDGFAGLRLDYLKLDLHTSKRGILDDDWGLLLQDDVVRMDVEADDLRLTWIEPITKFSTSLREQPLTFQVGAGGTLAHRDYALRGKTDDGLRTQDAELRGDLVFAAARARATWRDFAFDVDYAICPQLTLGGDWEDVQQDLELRASYTVPLRDLTFFAGYRYSRMSATGHEHELRYDADLLIDGYQLGVVLTF